MRIFRATLCAASVALMLTASSSIYQRAVYAGTLVPGDSMAMGTCRTSNSGALTLCAQNLGSGFYGMKWTGVLCGSFIWVSTIDASCTSGYGSHTSQTTNAGSSGFAQMQSDGNFVLYTGSNVAVWATNTNGFGSTAFLNLQDDGNLVVYYSTNIPIWSIF